MVSLPASTPGGRPLRVALLAPPALAVPPDGYGGTEAVIHALAQGLERAGCDALVLAAGTMLESFQEPVGLALPRAEAVGCEFAHAALVFAAARRGTLGQLDLIHDHTKTAGAVLAPFSTVPTLTTVHNDWSPGRELAYGARPDHPFVFLSDAHARRFPGVAKFGVVYNGIDLAGVPFRASGREDYVLYLGRFSRTKGPGQAIAAARLAGVPIVLAGTVDPGDPECFQEDVAPYVDGIRVRLAGQVSGGRKWGLLSRARALLAPVAWEEPFGLTAVEAMACGTPVLAFGRGAVPEIVRHGVTGYVLGPGGLSGRNGRSGPEGGSVLPGTAELASGIGAASRIDPYECRAWVARRFSADAMARAYLALYRKLLIGRMDVRRVAAAPSLGGERGDSKGGVA